MISNVLQRLKCAARPADGWMPATASHALADDNDVINKEDKDEKEDTEMRLFLPDKAVPQMDV